MKEDKREALAQFHRNNILTTAERLFSEKGIEKTTMDDIAKVSDYSKATLYVYFQNKEAIVNTLTYNSMKALYDSLHHGLSQSNNLFITYKAICYELVRYEENYPLYFQIAMQDINVHIYHPDTPPIFKDIFEVGEAINGEIGLFLHQGMESGLVKSELAILPTIFYFWASLTGIIKLASEKRQYIETSMHMTKQEFLDYNFKLLLQSVLKEGVQNVY